LYRPLPGEQGIVRKRRRCKAHRGGLNNDTLTGHGGNDIIDGGDGADYIQDDGLFGGAGNDTL
jgi:Ca2+-binding RTX toxin-like protein